MQAREAGVQDSDSASSINGATGGYLSNHRVIVDEILRFVHSLFECTGAAFEPGGVLLDDRRHLLPLHAGGYRGGQRILYLGGGLTSIDTDRAKLTADEAVAETSTNEVVRHPRIASMDFLFSDEQRLLKETLREYALAELLPDYARWDRGETFPREKIRDLGELGVLGIRVPERYGGSEESFVSLGIAAEELSRGDFNVGQLLQLSSIAAELLGGYAGEQLREAWLPGLARGEKLICFALTEPGVGSDAAAISTTAKRDGESYVVNGEKASITLAGMADACIVFARTGESGARGIGALLVPLDSPNVSRQVYDSVGEKLTQRGSLFFDDVRVPVGNRIGAADQGFIRAMEAFDYNRAIIALGCVGTAMQSLDETVAFAKERTTFGKPIAKHQAVSFQIAEHLTLLSGARALAYETLILRDRKEPHTKQAAMSKWLGPKTAVDAIHGCMLLHGWSGYGNDLPFGQRLRDVIGLEVGDGTPEIMKGIIAREVFGREYMAYR